MKKIIKGKILIWPVIGLFLLITSCNKKSETHDLASSLESNSSAKTSTAKGPSQAFKDYWYAGKAEITSYKLEQARYGEIREGKAVLIYVTEDFLPNKQVKADNQNPNNISVLKLNATKKFNTGLYPYSIMQSTFYPVSNNQHAIKITSSIQEWCGQVYAQLNNKDKFEVASYSYFESEGDKNFKLVKSILENELWTQLRIDPKSLPVGNLQIIPSLEYSRLKHVDLKAYNAQVSLTNNTYSIEYPELDRTLTIQFNPNFPHDILGWEETFKSGFGKNAKTLTTKATKLNTIKSAYWGKNSNKDEVLRDTLQLN
ncbi:septum formation inhibitor Maf [Hwangdonia sp.]|uniref:septum formation inhibitor Maf n=1 Tax=Hwangdonia sp. TaxID=1883432 RepID=UPI003AB5BCE7